MDWYFGEGMETNRAGKKKHKYTTAISSLKTILTYLIAGLKITEFMDLFCSFHFGKVSFRPKGIFKYKAKSL